MPRHRWRRLALAATVPFAVAITIALAGAAADSDSPRRAAAAPVVAVPAAAEQRRAVKVLERERRLRRERVVLVRATRRATSTAREQIGDAYAWAGSGPSAFDCSGLTRWAFASAGVHLPHSSFAQAHVGRPVSRGRVRAGDLVFFSTAGPGASHVGVAINEATVVSATSSGVQAHPISDAYWGAHYIGARRVFTT